MTSQEVTLGVWVGGEKALLDLDPGSDLFDTDNPLGIITLEPGQSVPIVANGDDVGLDESVFVAYDSYEDAFGAAKRAQDTPVLSFRIDVLETDADIGVATSLPLLDRQPDTEDIPKPRDVDPERCPECIGEGDTITGMILTAKTTE